MTITFSDFIEHLEGDSSYEIISTNNQGNYSRIELIFKGSCFFDLVIYEEQNIVNGDTVTLFLYYSARPLRPYEKVNYMAINQANMIERTTRVFYEASTIKLSASIDATFLNNEQALLLIEKEIIRFLLVAEKIKETAIDDERKRNH